MRRGIRVAQRGAAAAARRFNGHLDRDKSTEHSTESDHLAGCVQRPNFEEHDG